MNWPLSDFKKKHVSMLGEFAQHLAVHRLRLPLWVSSNVPTHEGGVQQIPSSKSVDSSGGDVTTDRRQTASLDVGSFYDSNIERCCQIRKPRSQEIGIPVLLLHQSKPKVIDKSEVLGGPLLDHHALR